MAFMIDGISCPLAILLVLFLTNTRISFLKFAILSIAVFVLQMVPYAGGILTVTVGGTLLYNFSENSDELTSGMKMLVIWFLIFLVGIIVQSRTPKRHINQDAIDQIQDYFRTNQNTQVQE